MWGRNTNTRPGRHSRCRRRPRGTETPSLLVHLSLAKHLNVVEPPPSSRCPQRGEERLVFFQNGKGRLGERKHSAQGQKPARRSAGPDFSLPENGLSPSRALAPADAALPGDACHRSAPLGPGGPDAQSGARLAKWEAAKLPFKTLVSPLQRESF